MFGYGCPSSIDLAQGLSSHTELIAMVKDNNGSAYIPEFGFNGIGDLTPGFGYQIKVTDAIEGFSLCDWYVNDIPEDNIVSLQEENSSLQTELDSIYATGCTDSLACNYLVGNLYEDGSCQYSEGGIDCEGNITEYLLGMEAEGGIVFYIDETGEHGLVAAIEDLPGSYQWGCFEEYVEGADGQGVGTGYQNTIDIVNQGCFTENGGITAAQATINYEFGGFDNWYLPSIEELSEIQVILVNAGFHPSGEFEESKYWSSTEIDNVNAANILFTGGWIYWNSKSSSKLVRPIRSF